MFSYEVGVGVAFLLWAYSAIMLVVSVNSQFERNLNRFGQRLSWLTLTPKAMEPKDQTRSTAAKIFKYLFVVGFGLPFILTSWLYVLLAVGSIIYRLSRDAGAPQAVKEFRWRMRNQELTFDQLIRGLMQGANEDLNKFEEFKESLVYELDERGVKHG